MLLRLIAGLAFLTLSSTAGFSDTINLRKSCEPWEHIPANEALKSPVAALLLCSDEEGSWLSMQIMCFPETAEIELRYRPSFPIVAPIPPEVEAEDLLPVDVAQNEEPQTDATPELELEQLAIEPGLPPLGEKEMLFFDFPRIGVTSVVKYGFDTRDWTYREREPMAQLFRSLISGNYADVSLLATGTAERLPLRGSTKALRPVVETCRLAKRKLDKEAAQKIQD